MTPQSFLDLSTRINQLVLPTEVHRQVLDLHLARYKWFYDTSSRGHACTYCRLTIKGFETERAHTIQLLTEFKTSFEPNSHIPIVAQNLKHVCYLLEALDDKN